MGRKEQWQHEGNGDVDGDGGEYRESNVNSNERGKLL